LLDGSQKHFTLFFILLIENIFRMAVRRLPFGAAGDEG
jgi:hypothetical protein